MKRWLWYTLPLFLIALVLAACSEPPMTAADTAHVAPDAAGKAPNAASSFVIEDRWTDTYYYDNPCTGETMEIEQDGLFRFRFTLDGTGGVHATQHIVLHETAVGPSCVQYVGNTTINQVANVAVVNGQIVDKGTVTTRLVAQGGADDLYGYQHYQFVIDANGRVIVDRNRFVDYACR